MVPRAYQKKNGNVIKFGSICVTFHRVTWTFRGPAGCTVKKQIVPDCNNCMPGMFIVYFV